MQPSKAMLLNDCNQALRLLLGTRSSFSELRILLSLCIAQCTTTNIFSVPAGFLEKLSISCVSGDYFFVILLQTPSMLHLHTAAQNFWIFNNAKSP